MKSLIIALTILSVLSPLTAQTITHESPVDNRAYFRIGIEPATMMTFGFQRDLNIRLLAGHVTAFLEWGTTTVRPGWSNSELKTGGMLPLFKRGHFMLVNALNISAGSVTTHNFDSKKFAFGDEIALGLYKKGWFAALTAEYEKIFLNNIEHTEYYRTTYYEDAEDGWYKGAGGMVQFGIDAGATIIGAYDMHLEIKMPFTEKFNSYGGSPLHVNVGLGYKF